MNDIKSYKNLSNTTCAYQLCLELFVHPIT